MSGELNITVHGAKSLKVIPLFGKQDPYCIVQCGSETCQTKTHENGHTEPSWEETFSFTISSKMASTAAQEVVHFKVKDKNTLKDGKIGRADIRLSEFIQTNGLSSKWIQLIDYDDYSKMTGLLHISVQFQPFVKATTTIPATSTKSEVGQQSKPPLTVVAQTNSRLAQKKHLLVEKHNISPFFANKLLQLEEFEIVLVCDDSGSMNSANNYLPNNAISVTTRWDELKATATMITEIAGLLDESGLDIYFLNRPPIFNVKTTQEIDLMFIDPPRGFTPIRDTISRIFRDKAYVEKKLLIIVCTDGQPTTSSGQDDEKELFTYLTQRKPINKSFITFACCTDDDNAIGYLEQWDKSIPNFDVVDDYATERNQIQQIQGAKFPFSLGDYVVKMLLGVIDPEIDQWDEQKRLSSA